MNTHRIFALALIFFALSLASPLQALHQTHHTTKHTKKKAKKKPPKSLTRKLAAVRRHREQITAQLRDTTRKVRKAKVDLNVVDSQLDHLERRLDVTTAELIADRKRQRELTRLLAADQVQLSQQSEDVRKRIRQMYMQGNSPALTILIGTKSSGDIASRAYFVERVMKADANALKAYKDLVCRISSQKAEADRILERIRGRERDQKEEEGELQETREAKNDTLHDLQSKKEELQGVLDQLDRDEANVQRQILAAIARGGGSSSPRRFTGRFLQPVAGRIGSSFGMRFHPILHKMRLHAGQDFPAPTGTPIDAAANGVVVGAEYMRGFGNCIIIDHGGGIATVYAHCSRILVGNGEHVTRGQHIGNVGSTGLATGPHLHFEVHVNGKPVNPMSWLR